MIIVYRNFDDKYFLVAKWVIPSLLILSGLINNDSKITELVFSNRLIVFIGNISFEIFLIHQLVIRVYQNNLVQVFNNQIIVMIVLLIITIVYVYIYKLIQYLFKRTIKWKL